MRIEFWAAQVYALNNFRLTSAPVGSIRCSLRRLD
jgi:hypothetical protein